MKHGMTEGVMKEITMEDPITSRVVGSIATSPLNSGRVLQPKMLKPQRAWPTPSPEIYSTMAGQGKHFFTPPDIVLYTNGSGDSQAILGVCRPYFSELINPDQQTCGVGGTGSR